jgi:hypothetical protein
LADVIQQSDGLLGCNDKSASTAYAYAIAEAEKNGVLEGGIDTVAEAIAVNEYF